MNLKRGFTRVLLVASPIIFVIVAVFCFFDALGYGVTSELIFGPMVIPFFVLALIWISYYLLIKFILPFMNEKFIPFLVRIGKWITEGFSDENTVEVEAENEQKEKKA